MPRPFSMMLLFQSTPDLVNRENLNNVGLVKTELWFQSTPDLVNRENADFAGKSDIEIMFQSTPDLVNRENFRSFFTTR